MLLSGPEARDLAAQVERVGIRNGGEPLDGLSVETAPEYGVVEVLGDLQ